MLASTFVKIEPPIGTRRLPPIVTDRHHGEAKPRRRPYHGALRLYPNAWQSSAEAALDSHSRHSGYSKCDSAEHMSHYIDHHYSEPFLQQISDIPAE